MCIYAICAFCQFTFFAFGHLCNLPCHVFAIFTKLVFSVSLDFQCSDFHALVRLHCVHLGVFVHSVSLHFVHLGICVISHVESCRFRQFLISQNRFFYVAHVVHSGLS